jgi:MFS family permease
MTYRELFARRDTRRLFASSLVGRLSVGILDLPLIVVAERVSGSYAVAGAAIGAHAAGVALSSPARGRLLDRHGARRAMPPLALVHGAALGGVPVAAEVVEATWLVLVLSAVAGATSPAFPAAMRLEWRRILDADETRLERAYAFETSAQITVFIFGALAAAAGLATIGAGATVGLCAALALGGGLAFAAQARAEPSRAAGGRARSRAPIRVPAVRTLVAATLLADVGLGVIDVAVTAFAQERASASTAGLLLAVFSVSSAIGGIAYGARTWRTPAGRRLAVILGCGAAALALLALADSVVVLALLLAVAGPPAAAQWATASVAMDRAAPPETNAEAFNWLSTANATGFAVGGLAAGVAVETSGPAAAFVAAAASLVLAAALVAARHRTLVDAPLGAAA